MEQRNLDALDSYVERFFDEDDSIQPREGKEKGDTQMSVFRQFYCTKIDEIDLLIDFGSGYGTILYDIKEKSNWPLPPEYWAVDLPDILDDLRIDREIRNCSKVFTPEVFYSQAIKDIKDKKVLVVIRNTLHHLDISAIADLFYHLYKYIPVSSELYLQDVEVFPRAERTNVCWDSVILKKKFIECGFDVRETKHSSVSGYDWFSMILVKEKNAPKRDRKFFLDSFVSARLEQYNDLRDKLKRFHAHISSFDTQEQRDRAMYKHPFGEFNISKYHYMTHNLALLSIMLAENADSDSVKESQIVTSVPVEVYSDRVRFRSSGIEFLNRVFAVFRSISEHTDYHPGDNRIMLTIGEGSKPKSEQASAVLGSVTACIFKHYFDNVRIRTLDRTLTFDNEGNCDVLCEEVLYGYSLQEINFSPCGLDIPQIKNLKELSFTVLQDEKIVEVAGVMLRGATRYSITNMALLHKPIRNTSETTLKWSYKIPKLFYSSFVEGNWDESVWFEQFSHSGVRALDKINVRFVFPDEISQLLEYCIVSFPPSSSQSSQKDFRITRHQDWSFLSGDKIMFGQNEQLCFRFVRRANYMDK